MNFTVSELHSLTFRKKSLGYSRKDVHDFLKRAGEDYLRYQQLEEELKECQEKVALLEEKCADYVEVVTVLQTKKEAAERETKRLMYLEQQAAQLRKMTTLSEQMSESVEEQAKQRLDEAEQEATQRIQRAKQEVATIVHQALAEVEKAKLTQLGIEKATFLQKINVVELKNDE